jgi:hypothetical protein
LVVLATGIFGSAALTTAYAQRDSSPQQQTCPDGSQPDSNGNCPTQPQPRQPQQQQLPNQLNYNNLGLIINFLGLIKILSNNNNHNRNHSKDNNSYLHQLQLIHPLRININPKLRNLAPTILAATAAAVCSSMS